MNDFLFRMPTKVMFGVGAAKKVPGLCKEMGFSRPHVFRLHDKAIKILKISKDETK